MSANAPAARTEVVVVSYRTRDLLAECLASLARFVPGVPVIVVDNASDDGSPEMVRADHPEARLIALEENRGFAAAVNAGVAAGERPLVLLLNGDTALVDDPLPALAGAMDRDPRCAVAGPRLVYPDGRAQESREAFPTVGATLAGFFGGGRRGTPPAEGDLEVSPGLARPPWYLMGAALLFRREALHDVGPLDENYFFYLEEVDWFRRAARDGWGWTLVPEARVVHHLGASLRAADPALEARIKRNWYRSRLRYFTRHEGTYRAGLLRAGSLGPLAANALRYRLKSLATRDPKARARARAAADIFRDYLHARVGPC